MKKLIFISIALSIFACRQAPNRPTIAVKTPAEGENGAGNNESENAEGVIDKGPTTGGYQNLACDERDTHRGIRAWRRLSNIELQNTVAAVFGLRDGLNTTTFVNDIPKAEVFDTAMIAANFVNTNRFKGYMSYAESIGAKADLAKLFPCIDQGKSCVQSNLAKILAAAWRRPSTEAEQSELVLTFDNLVKDGFKNDQAARYLVQAIVLSHHFLYRSELGEMKGDDYELTDWELASAVSYATIRSVPDEELKKLAEKGGLRDSAVLKKQAERLLATPAARTAWKDFAQMWLMTEDVLEVAKSVPEFNDALKKKLSEETKNLFVETMFSGDKNSFEHLLTTSSIPAEDSSAFIYGNNAVNGRIEYKEAQRRGLLGQANFLASGAVTETTNPVKRGVFIMSRLLCSGFPPAPPVEFPELKPGLSTKEVFEQHAAGPCAGCHKVIDQFGFAFENFNEIGKFRDKDGAKAIAINAKVKIDAKEVTITSPQEVSQAIARSNQGMECFVRQSFRYAFGRIEYAPTSILGELAAEPQKMEGQLDSCQIKSATSAMKDQGGNLKAALIDLISNPGFRYRLAGPK